jgi:acyl-coenzyme A synthetase/AMP-(fatty) acid ligase
MGYSYFQLAVDQLPRRPDHRQPLADRVGQDDLLQLQQFDHLCLRARQRDQTHPGFNIKILNDENEELELGETGRVCCRLPMSPSF